MNNIIEKTLYILAILSLCFFLYFGLYFVEKSIDLNGGAKFSVHLLIVTLWANIISSLRYYRRISKAYETVEQDNSRTPDSADTISD